MTDLFSFHGLTPTGYNLLNINCSSVHSTLPYPERHKKGWADIINDTVVNFLSFKEFYLKKKKPLSKLYKDKINVKEQDLLFTVIRFE